MTLDEHSVQGRLVMTPADDPDVVIDDLRRQVADLHADRDQLLAGVARLEARIRELERERPGLLAAVEALEMVRDAADELVRLPIATLPEDTFDAVCELQIALAPLITEGDAR